jgi:hypothetical protein
MTTVDFYVKRRSRKGKAEWYLTVKVIRLKSDFSREILRTSKIRLDRTGGEAFASTIAGREGLIGKTVKNMLLDIVRTGK